MKGVACAKPSLESLPSKAHAVIINQLSQVTSGDAAMYEDAAKVCASLTCRGARAELAHTDSTDCRCSSPRAWSAEAHQPPSALRGES